MAACWCLHHKHGSFGKVDGEGGFQVQGMLVGNTAQADEGHFDNREYSIEVIYNSSDQDSDFGDNEHTVGSGGNSRGVKR